MTADDDWEKRRHRAILATFETGRPVFADTEGEPRYLDGDRELVSPDAGLPETTRQATSLAKAMRATRVAFVASLIAAACNLVAGFWRPWHFAFAAVMLFSAFLWLRIYRGQRALYGAKK